MHSVIAAAVREVAGVEWQRAHQKRAPDLQRYARDPFLHLEKGHIWIPDLRTLEPVNLNPPWAHQEEVMRSWFDLDYLTRSGILRLRNVHEEKSRQMGLTWILAYAVWWVATYHFAPLLVLHLNSAEVDDGGPNSTIDSFFGRVRYIQTIDDDDGRPYLPREFTAPLVWKSSPESLIINPVTRSYVVGEGATPNPGRGGRYKGGVLDEAARIPWGESVHASLTRAIPDGRFYNSTPAGEDNAYYRIRDTRPRGYIFLRHHWSKHPVYGMGAHVAGAEPEACVLCQGNVAGIEWDATEPRAHRYEGKITSPWYDDAVTELTDQQVAAELDIDYAGSLEGRVYPEFSEDVHVEADGIPFEPTLPIEISVDYGFIGYQSFGIFQEAPFELRMIGEFEASGLTPDQDVAGLRNAVRRLIMAAGISSEQADKMLTVNAMREWTVVGDPAGEITQKSTGRPLKADYARHGLVIQSKPRSIATTIIAVKRLLRNRPKPLRVSGPTCVESVGHFKMNRWPTDREGKLKPNAREPENDRHNHMMRGIAYYVSWKYPPPDTGTAISEVTTRREPEDESGRIDPGLGYDTQF